MVGAPRAPTRHRGAPRAASARPRRITADSRQVRAGDAFAAFPGQTTATAARSSPMPSRAASARCCGRRAASAGIRRGASPTSRSRTCARSSAPSPISSTATRRKRLWVVGVTGTNGKTSCTHWIAQCLDACGRRAAIARHARQRARRRARSRRRTRRRMPRACTRCWREFTTGGAQAVAMEVSSHGLDQGRVNAVRVRRRAVHQSHARPPRLSRDDGGVRRGEGEAVRLARPRRRGGQRGRSVRPEPRRVDPRPRAAAC